MAFRADWDESVSFSLDAPRVLRDVTAPNQPQPNPIDLTMIRETKTGCHYQASAFLMTSPR